MACELRSGLADTTGGATSVRASYKLAVIGAGWFAPPDDKRVSAPVAAPASVSPKGRVWQLTEEMRTERAHSDEMHIELETSQLELKRALRREECGAAAVVAEGRVGRAADQDDGAGAQGAPPAQTRKQSPLLPSAHPSVPLLPRRTRRARFALSTALRRAR